MRPPLHQHGQLAHIAAGILLLALPFVMHAQSGASAVSASTKVRLELRPHCEEAAVPADGGFGGPLPILKGIVNPKGGDGGCGTFAVRDPGSTETPLLKPGDILDLDLVLQNSTKMPLRRVRAWIDYDPEVLQNVTVVVHKNFPLLTPGEADAVPAEGIIKIQAATMKAVNATGIRVARIRATIAEGAPSVSVLSFAEDETEVEASEQLLSLETPGTLFVRVTQDSAHSAPLAPTSSSTFSLFSASSASSIPLPSTASSEPSVSPASSSSIASIASVASTSSAATHTEPDSGAGGSSALSAPAVASSAPQRDSVFSLLQVQNLRVTTEGGSAFLAWDALPSTELAGYSVHYGTVSGQYLQRRRVDAKSLTLAIRALPEKTRYYFAVRGATRTGKETEFSQEVAVTIGDPKTSTAPLIGRTSVQQIKPPKTDGAVAGETGAPSAILLFVAASALLGTAIAFRRQLLAPPSRHG